MRGEKSDIERIESWFEVMDEMLIKIADLLREQNRILETKKPKQEPRTRFTPPNVDEVSDYVKELKGSIDPNGFIDYYQARGWKLNNGTPVKDWKACVRTWERNGFSKGPKKEESNTGAVL